MPDIAIILIVVLVLVIIWRGPSTLPRLGEALGQAVRGARRAAEDNDGDGDRGSRDSSGDRPAR